jgi:hypothetical protein
LGRSLLSPSLPFSLSLPLSPPLFFHHRHFRPLLKNPGRQTMAITASKRRRRF